MSSKDIMHGCDIQVNVPTFQCDTDGREDVMTFACVCETVRWKRGGHNSHKRNII